MKSRMKMFLVVPLIALSATSYSYANHPKKPEYETWGKFNKSKPTMSQQMGKMHSSMGQMLQGIKWMQSNFKGMESSTKDKEIKNALKDMDNKISDIGKDMQAIHKIMADNKALLKSKETKK